MAFRQSVANITAGAFATGTAGIVSHFGGGRIVSDRPIVRGRESRNGGRRRDAGFETHAVRRINAINLE